MNTKPKAYLVGGGIGSLAAAAFMIRDGGLPGGDITILEMTPVLGGSLDGAGDPTAGYSIRGARMFTPPARPLLLPGARMGRNTSNSYARLLTGSQYPIHLAPQDRDRVGKRAASWLAKSQIRPGPVRGTGDGTNVTLGPADQMRIDESWLRKERSHVVFRHSERRFFSPDKSRTGHPVRRAPYPPEAKREIAQNDTTVSDVSFMFHYTNRAAFRPGLVAG